MAGGLKDTANAEKGAEAMKLLDAKDYQNDKPKWLYLKHGNGTIRIPITEFRVTVCERDKKLSHFNASNEFGGRPFYVTVSGMVKSIARITYRRERKA